MIVCGWYTPDYAHWCDALVATLDEYGIAHDFIIAPKHAGSWEANTMRKASEVQQAMQRHPEQVIVWLDVDCLVAGPLDPLEHIGGDVAVYMRGKRRRMGGYKMHCITRTIVLKPTQGARDFVAKWVELSRVAKHGDVDQTTFLLAMGDCHGTTFQPLHRKWSAVKGESGGFILHDNASVDVAKAGPLSRFAHGFGIARGARSIKNYAIAFGLLLLWGMSLTLFGGFWGPL
jgi:hypothetical protein